MRFIRKDTAQGSDTAFTDSSEPGQSSGPVATAEKPSRRRRGESSTAEPVRPPRHRGNARPLRATVNNARFMWQPNPEYGKPGNVTTSSKVREQFYEAVAAHPIVNVRGVLIEADDTSEPGVMAALAHISSAHQPRFDSDMTEVDAWFADHKPGTTVTRDEV